MSLIFLLFTYHHVFFGAFTGSVLVVPNDRPLVWELYGDLNIGLLENVQFRNTGDTLCKGAPDILNLQRTEIVLMTIDQLNARDDLLPNITLGFVALDACRGPKGAVARSVYFIPDHLPCGTTTTTTNSSDTTCERSGTATPQDPDIDSLIEAQKHYDVVGVLGPGWSSEAVPVASLYNVFQIPMISGSATSDELSDKNRYEFFSRVCPPDRFLADAIVDVLFHFDWTYIIVLYSEGSYGENLAKQLDKKLKGSGLCFAISYRISSVADDAEYEELAEKLAEEKNSRIIVSFMDTFDIEHVMVRLRPKVPKNPFIYLAGDWFQTVYSKPHADMSEGSMFLNTLPVDIPGFEAKFVDRMPWDEPVNPWLVRFWEHAFQCSWDVG